MRGRLAGAIVLALGLAAAVLARRLPAQAGFGLGPAFLPFWTGLVLAGCGVWLLAWPGAADGAPVEGRALGRAFASFALIGLYALTLAPLGYLLSTAAFLVAGTFLLEPDRPRRALGVGLAGAGLLLLVFRVWLRVPLPGGPGGF